MITNSQNSAPVAYPEIFVTAASGNSYKVALVAKQVGRSCHFIHLDVIGGETQRAAFRAINPMGQVPYMRLADGASIGESNAIAWYLAEGSSLMPHTAVERAQAIQWLIFEQTRLEPFISPARFYTTLAPGRRAAVEDQMKAWTQRACHGLKVLDLHLERSSHIVGDSYTVADICVFGYVHLANEAGITLSQFPAISSWLNIITSQPGFASIDSLLPAT